MAEIDELKQEAKTDEKKNFIFGFLQFVKKYGVVGLALGVVMGNAVNTLVKSLVENIINPILAKIIGKVDLSSIVFQGIKIGSFINDVINFLILLFVVYTAVSLLINRFLTEDEKKSLKI